uniref:Uncharacterized protein n=1 Tax=Acrobeloides nanus TaxID=290746 RepID=A0A914EKY6_9BILA
MQIQYGTQEGAKKYVECIGLIGTLFHFMERHKKFMLLEDCNTVSTHSAASNAITSVNQRQPEEAPGQLRQREPIPRKVILPSTSSGSLRSYSEYYEDVKGMTSREDQSQGMEPMEEDEPADFLMPQ